MKKKGLKAKVFDGKKLADTINKEIQEEIQVMVNQGNRYVSIDKCVLSYYV